MLVAAGTVAVVLTSRAQAPTPAANHTAGPAATTASRAAAWVTSQVSHDAVVACDHLMCGALAAAGFPGRNLRPITSASPQPPHSDVVVVTPVVQHQFGPGLATDWAPVVLARFGSGAGTISVRVVSPHGAAAYETALTADLRLRRIGGAGLLTNPQVTASALARKQLTSGQVDARLIIVLTALASVHPVDIVAFGTGFAGTSAGVPLRMADIAADDAAAKMSGSAYLRFLLTLVHAQPAPYTPPSAGPVSANGESLFQIQFAAPSPLGLLGPQGP